MFNFANQQIGKVKFSLSTVGWQANTFLQAFLFFSSENVDIQGQFVQWRLQQSLVYSSLLSYCKMAWLKWLLDFAHSSRGNGCKHWERVVISGKQSLWGDSGTIFLFATWQFPSAISGLFFHCDCHWFARLANCLSLCSVNCDPILSPVAHLTRPHAINRVYLPWGAPHSKFLPLLHPWKLNLSLARAPFLMFNFNTFTWTITWCLFFSPIFPHGKGKVLTH